MRTFEIAGHEFSIGQAEPFGPVVYCMDGIVYVERRNGLLNFHQAATIQMGPVHMQKVLMLTAMAVADALYYQEPLQGYPEQGIRANPEDLANLATALATGKTTSDHRREVCSHPPGTNHCWACGPEKREKEAQRKRLADAQDKLVKWLAGENVWVPRDLGTDFLRIRPSDPATVETSRGSDVPLEHVQRALPVVLRKLRAKEAWHTNGETIRLGYYSVTRISADGVLTVGCHNFTRAEVERFAEVLKTLAA